MNRTCVLVVALAIAPACVLGAEGTVDTGPDTAEPGSIAAIAEFTSEPRFLNDWVAYVPASDSVASPADFLGHVIGAPGELTRPEKVAEYARNLAASSPRVHVETIGESEEGRDIVLLAIADEAGIRELDRLKSAAAALADPRNTSPAEAKDIVESARPAYYFNCNLHADETGSGEMCMELAYRLAVSEQPMIQSIRKNLLVLINPVSEPDGRAKVTDWFYRYLKGKTDFDALPRQSPPYWGRYVFVDINRDAHQRAFAATRAVHKMYLRLLPGRRARPARGDPPALELERDGSVQPASRSHRDVALARTEFPRNDDDERDGHARRVDVEFRRGIRPPLSRFRGDQSQRDRPRL